MRRKKLSPAAFSFHPLWWVIPAGLALIMAVPFFLNVSGDAQVHLAIAENFARARPFQYNPQGEIVVASTSPFWTIMLAFGFPFIRKHMRELPAVPRGASLKPRRVELFPGAWVWPFVAWALLTVLVFVGEWRPLTWLGPLLGLGALVGARYGLRYVVLEGEPLGGDDPEALARQYERFRKRRVKTMYWLMVVLVLVIFIGTLFPFLSGLFSEKKISLQPEYFTKITSPGGLFLLLLIGMCPHLLRYGLRRHWRVIAAVLVAVAAVGAWSGMRA